LSHARHALLRGTEISQMGKNRQSVAAILLPAPIVPTIIVSRNYGATEEIGGKRMETADTMKLSDGLISTKYSQKPHLSFMNTSLPHFGHFGSGTSSLFMWITVPQL
jgi:hypothetical protein